MNRKKPYGQEFIDWCRSWDDADHAGKVKLCEDCGVSYEVGRHWRSDCVLPKKEKPEKPEPEDKGIDTAARSASAMSEILGMQPKIELDFVSFDIETSNLTADFSIMLTACIKPFGKESMVFRGDIYPDWHTNRVNDQPLCEAVALELAKHAVVITHYGTGFDLPYIRTKMMKYGLPPLPVMFGVDTYSIAKANFRLSRKRLQTMAEYLNLGKKEGVEGNLWLEAAMSGSKEAMDSIVEHNILDVEILEKLAAISFPYMRSMRRI